MRIVHLFNWKLNDIDVNKVKYQGFDAIQISPIQPVKQDEGPWWILYQGTDFSIGNKQIGSKQDLINLCNRANNLGIKIIVDVVLNHLASEPYNNKELHKRVPDRFRKAEYFKDKQDIGNWDNRWEVIHRSIGLPTLDTNNEEVQQMAINFLNELIDCGVGGFRFDSGKNIGLPEEGCSFWPNVLGGLKNKNLFNYAEVIFANNNLIESYQKYINVLTEGSSWDKDKLVTFIDSHDLHLSFQYTKNMTNDITTREYEILRKNFKNTVFYARPFNDLWQSEEIRRINYL